MESGAEWNCENCRKRGLERNRNCGWAVRKNEHRDRVVWFRRGVSSTECPKSAVTAQSTAWLEWFAILMELDSVDVENLAAKDAEAFAVLKQELRKVTYERHS